MKKHLSSREFVAALDDELDASRLEHVKVCGPCREQLRSLQETAESLGATNDVPEPSPLFWTQFEERVRRATADEPVPSRAASWWNWRSVAVLAPAAVAVMLVVVTLDRSAIDVPDVRDGLVDPALPGLPTPPAEVPAIAAGVAAPEGAGWEQIAELAAVVPADEWQAVEPGLHLGADALIEELTQAQRAELLRLLREQMGGGA